MDQLETATRQLFTEYPQYARGQPVFVFSESYGGKYVPELATRLLAGNKAGAKPAVNLYAAARS